MTTFDPSSEVRCQAVAAVSAATLVTLISTSENVQPESGSPGCELGVGHDGGHVALVATAHGGDEWWWLRWGGRLGDATEVIQIDPCHAELPQGRYADDCLLPEGHRGPHSFDLPPLSSRSAQRHLVSRRPTCREAGFRLPGIRPHGVRSCAGPGGRPDAAIMERRLLARVHNPSGDACACLPTCWCRRTKLGYAVRWYTPGRFHRMPNPSRFANVPD
jgi:hypothetical protein